MLLAVNGDRVLPGPCQDDEGKKNHETHLIGNRDVAVGSRSAWPECERSVPAGAGQGDRRGYHRSNSDFRTHRAGLSRESCARLEGAATARAMDRRSGPGTGPDVL